VSNAAYKSEHGMLNDEGTRRDWKERQVREVDSKKMTDGEKKSMLWKYPRMWDILDVDVTLSMW